MEASGQRSFAIGSCLGKGGFGEVYRATMSTGGGLRREVAIKLLRADLALADDALLRLRDEGRMLARLDHPALLVVFDLVEIDGRIALVTEFVDGEDLGDCIRAGLPRRALLQGIGTAADALHAAWTAPLGPQGRALRLAHRDIKPSNLRISRHGTLKVLDFGIARSDEMTREARTATNFIVGSPTYMAPERFLDAEVRSASDVWALGCCLYEGLTNERLFGGQSALVMSTMALSQPRYEAYLEDKRDEGLPAELQELVDACLAFDPASRPTAQQLARRCEELADAVGGASLRRWTRDREWPTASAIAGPLDGRVISETTIHGASDPVAPPRPRRFGWWLAGGSAVAGVALLGVALVVGGLSVWWASSSTGREVQVSASDPVEQPTSVASPAPSPSSPVAVPVPDPVSAPEPEPEPEPVSPAAPAPRRVATGAVSVSGSHTDVVLERDGTVIALAASAVAVPVGTWNVRSRQPLVAPLTPAQVVVSEGAEIRLSCSRDMQRCAVP